MDEVRHKDQVAIVTGAGSGIGQATALRLAREGARVVGCDVNEQGLAATEGLIGESGKQALVLRTDVSEEADVSRLVAAALEAHGRIDVLANVAGVMDGFQPAHDMELANWDRVLRVNLTGPMLTCRAVLPQMMEQGAGAIVNVASIAALKGGGSGFSYVTSKHGLIGLTRSLAWTYQEYEIRCNAVCPGAVQTNIGQSGPPRHEWGFARQAAIFGAMRTQADPDEIATAISWLACDEARNVNGAVLSDDGGWSAS